MSILHFTSMPIKSTEPVLSKFIIKKAVIVEGLREQTFNPISGSTSRIVSSSPAILSPIIYDWLKMKIYKFYIVMYYVQAYEGRITWAARGSIFLMERELETWNSADERKNMLKFLAYLNRKMIIISHRKR